MIEIKRYDSNHAEEWNKVVNEARNGTFLHDRGYMDYHADRFLDHSLLVYRLGKLAAVFPANAKEAEISTHGGLTYGGLLATESLGADDTLKAFEGIASYYRSAGFKRIIYKPVPYVFHRYPCQEELYALFRVGAVLFRRDASSVIALNRSFSFSKGRKWSINKARKQGVLIRQSHDFSRFHGLLSDVLKKFNATPTHSLDELTLLASRFPNNIGLYEAELEGRLLAGAVIYDFGDSVHTQYMASSDDGRDIGALDFLVGELIGSTYAAKCYFSFGISTESQGRHLNAGLIAQKEGFGARTVAHDFYEWNLE